MELPSGNFPVGGTPGSDNHLWVGASCPCTVLDNFQCYKVRELSSVGDPSVSLKDQFGSGDARVRKAETICTPVDKNGEGIKHFPFHLVCYDVHPRANPKKEVLIANQFGEQKVVVKDAETLCVPSFKEVLGGATGRR